MFPDTTEGKLGEGSQVSCVTEGCPLAHWLPYGFIWIRVLASNIETRAGPTCGGHANASMELTRWKHVMTGDVRKRMWLAQIISKMPEARLQLYGH